MDWNCCAEAVTVIYFAVFSLAWLFIFYVSIETEEGVDNNPPVLVSPSAHVPANELQTDWSVAGRSGTSEVIIKVQSTVDLLFAAACQSEWSRLNWVTFTRSDESPFAV